MVDCFVDSGKIMTSSAGLRKPKVGCNIMEQMIQNGLNHMTLIPLNTCRTIPGEGCGSTKGLQGNTIILEEGEEGVEQD